MTHSEIVRKLIGNINPVADAAIDKERLENLEVYLQLFEDMLLDISFVAREKDSPYASTRKIGEIADKFLQNIKEEI